MDTLKQILFAIFGGEITASDIASLGVAVFAVFKSFTEWSAKKKLINATRELSAEDARTSALEARQSEVMKAMTLMANMITTAYLSSNTIDEATKAKIGAYASDLKTISGLNLTKEAVALIESSKLKHVENINKVENELKVESDETKVKLNAAEETAASFVEDLEV